MKRRIRSTWLSVSLAVLVAVGWGAAIVSNGRWAVALNGARAGLTAAGDPLSVTLGVRWGWPSRAWIERENVRAIGNRGRLWSREPDDTLGFGVIFEARSWSGNDTITVWHAGIALPWWYLLLVAFAAPLERLGRWLWSRRRSERRRRAGLCPACGYDLRQPGAVPRVRRAGGDAGGGGAGVRRLAADVLTVLCLAGLTAVVMLWVRSHRLTDRLGSYHDQSPSPSAGIPLSFNHRVAWRTIALSSATRPHRGRRHDHDGCRPSAGSGNQRGVAAPAPVNGWWWSPLEPGREPDSLVPPSSKDRFGVAAWSIDSTESFRTAYVDYTEDRTVRSSGVAAPHWGLAVLFVALPAARLLGAFRRGRRRERGPLAARRHREAGVRARGGVVAAAARRHAAALAPRPIHRRCAGTPQDRTRRRGGRARPVWRVGRVFSGHGSVGSHSLHQHPGGDGPWTAEPWRRRLEASGPRRRGGPGGEGRGV